MAHDSLRTTLAYTKSPKNSKRTTFQVCLLTLPVILHSKIKICSQKYKTDPDVAVPFSFSFSHYILKELLISKLKKTATLKAGNKKSKINDFKFSDDEDENVKPKRVSFMKTGRKSSPAPAEDSDRSKSENGHVDEELKDSRSDSSQSVLSRNSHPETRESPTSERSRRESSLSPPYDKTDGGQEKSFLFPQILMELKDVLLYMYIPCVLHLSLLCAGSIFEHELPKPKPRRIILKAGSNTEEESEAGGESSPRRQPTSSMSIHLSSTDVASSISSPGRRGTRPSRPHTAESRYLGTLRVLDLKATLKESQANDADTLRASVYQEWLKNKNAKMKESLRIKRQDERAQEEKKLQEELAKKQEAKASFEAWKQKKAGCIKAKLKQDQEMSEKKQKEMEEKRETVFEKWKKQRDVLLKERIKKQKLKENLLKQKHVEEKDERKRESVSAFSKWSEEKKEIIIEKVKMERRQKTIKEEEEKYEKDEKERMALEMYESWLQRKERQERRERRERRIHAILEEETPPPWSPPNRTVPFGK
uniref:Microtubule-associated protein 9 n=1 Tax=Scleropages formosus TaxID=113540 RepID=A0A8C9TWM5_SCLFO